uniref:Venom peptide n=1 Tax=Panagrellus redivivus TaxID=6233 RepID=A0A7E4VC28_PANRE
MRAITIIVFIVIVIAVISTNTYAKRNKRIDPPSTGQDDDIYDQIDLLVKVKDHPGRNKRGYPRKIFLKS